MLVRISTSLPLAANSPRGSTDPGPFAYAVGPLGDCSGCDCWFWSLCVIRKRIREYSTRSEEPEMKYETERRREITGAVRPNRVAKLHITQTNRANRRLKAPIEQHDPGALPQFIGPWTVRVTVGSGWMWLGSPIHSPFALLASIRKFEESLTHHRMLNLVTLGLSAANSRTNRPYSIRSGGFALSSSSSYSVFW